MAHEYTGVLDVICGNCGDTLLIGAVNFSRQVMELHCCRCGMMVESPLEMRMHTSLDKGWKRRTLRDELSDRDSEVSQEDTEIHTIELIISKPKG